MTGNLAVPLTSQIINSSSTDSLLGVFGDRFWLILIIAGLIYLWAFSKGQLAVKSQMVDTPKKW